MPPDYRHRGLVMTLTANPQEVGRTDGQTHTTKYIISLLCGAMPTINQCQATIINGSLKRLIDRIRAIIRKCPLITDTHTITLDWSFRRESSEGRTDRRTSRDVNFFSIFSSRRLR